VREEFGEIIEIMEHMQRDGLMDENVEF